MLKGYKTYVIAGLAGLLGFIRYMEWIDYVTYESLLALVTGGGLATLRNAVRTETAALPKP